MIGRSTPNGTKTEGKAVSKKHDSYRCANMRISCWWRSNGWCHYGHGNTCAFGDGGGGSGGGLGGSGMGLPVKAESLVKRKLLKCPNCGARMDEKDGGE